MKADNTFTADEITKILSSLTGPVVPTCDTSIDEKREQNLKTTIGVISWLLDGVCWAAEYRNRPEYSAQKIAEKAYCAMLDWRDWLVEAVDDLDNDKDVN